MSAKCVIYFITKTFIALFKAKYNSLTLFEGRTGTTRNMSFYAPETDLRPTGNILSQYTSHPSSCQFYFFVLDYLSNKVILLNS